MGPHDQTAWPCRSGTTRTPPWTGKLAPYRAFFEKLVVQDPDITLFELRDALMTAEGIKVHHSSIATLLSHVSFSYKKYRWWPPSVVAQG